MKVTFGSNIASLQVQRRLNSSTEDLRKGFERLSSGLRINRAGDDAAGLAIADALKADTRVYSQGIRNFNDGLSLLSVADSALEQLSDVATRLNELAEQASNGAYSNVQRKALDAEAQALSKEFTRIARSTAFNNISPLDGTVSQLQIQGGYGAQSGITSNLGGAIGTGVLGSASLNVLSGGGSRDITLGDVNGDGFLDIATSESTGSVGLRLGNGDGTFRAAQSLAMAAALTQNDLALKDLNNDGNLDVITAASSASGYTVVRLGNGDGTFRNPISSLIASSAAESISVGDVNGDGVLDYAVSLGFNQVQVMLGVGDGTFTNRVSYTTGTTHNAVSLGDFNGDGLLDLASAGNSTAEVRFGLGNGTFAAARSYDLTSTGGRGIASGDLNNDGHLDFAVGNGDRVELFYNNGSGGFSAAFTYSAFESTAGDLTLNDLNGDGYLDLISIGSQNLTVRLSNGGGSFAATATTYNVATNSYGVAAGDVNNDGVPDVLTAQDAGGGFVGIQLNRTTYGTHPVLQFSLATQADARQALPIFQRKLSQIAVQRGTIGAFQSRLEAGANALTYARDNSVSAESQIRDADVAQEAALLVRSQILQKSGAAVLAQANLEPKLALTLLTGRKESG